MMTTCPFCAEPTPKTSKRCRDCGERLEALVAHHRGPSLALKLILGGVLLAGVASTAAVLIPNMFRVHKNYNDNAAIGALKMMGAAQDIFRESDREGDGILDFGTLSELSSAGPRRSYGLLDQVLGSGTKQGYLFECSYSATTSELLWFATARPAIPGVTGKPYFATNHTGVIHYSLTAPIPMNTDDCTFPPARLQSGDIQVVRGRPWR